MTLKRPRQILNQTVAVNDARQPTVRPSNVRGSVQALAASNLLTAAVSVLWIASTAWCQTTPQIHNIPTATNQTDVATGASSVTKWKNPLVKKGKLDSPLVEVTPFVCRGKGKFVLLVESNDPTWPAFTFKYYASADLLRWTRVPRAVYGRDKYVGGPALYFADGTYYTLYLHALRALPAETPQPFPVGDTGLEPVTPSLSS